VKSKGKAAMELKPFTDLINAFGKVAAGLKAIVDLRKVEYKTIRRTQDETYRRIDATFNIVIMRVGDIQLMRSRRTFCAKPGG